MVKRPYGQKKDQRLGVRVSAASRQGLEELAKSLNLTVSDLIERIGKGDIPISVESMQGEYSAS